MKILWLCSKIIPEFQPDSTIQNAKPDSWISGVYNSIKQDERFQIYYLFPQKKKSNPVIIGNVCLIGYTQNTVDKFEETQKADFQNLLAEIKPDIVHIFGTEFVHSYAMIKACKEAGVLHKTVISIQGLVSVIAKHYYSFLPGNILHRYTLRDVLRMSNIYRQQKQFAYRGEYEKKGITLAKHVIGRTDWDKACIERINPNVQYHVCNETLRPAFYQNEWSLDTCQKHSVFVSQCGYPIKGFHLMLEAMADIVKQYPDAHLYTTGKSPLSLTFIDKMRQTYYNKYLCKLIKKYHLENHITFLGYLDEQQMCAQYLKAHVFVSPSTIENSPNSVGEAMILGVPTIASDVGGVKNLLEHGKEGFVYQADAPYMPAYYIKRIFADETLASKLSINAKRHAAELYDGKKNLETLLRIYREIIA